MTPPWRHAHVPTVERKLTCLPMSRATSTSSHPLLRRTIRRRYGYELAAKAYNGARSIYRQMLADFPSIGADNPMADNAYEALVFFAMYRAADGELTPEMMREVVGDLFELPVVKGAIGLSTNLNRAADMRRIERLVALPHPLGG